MRHIIAVISMALQFACGVVAADRAVVASRSHRRLLTMLGQFLLELGHIFFLRLFLRFRLWFEPQFLKVQGNNAVQGEESDGRADCTINVNSKVNCVDSEYRPKQ